MKHFSGWEDWAPTPRKGDGLCNFGLVTPIVVATLVEAGVGEATAAIAGAALTGAAVGTVGSAATGGDPLKGALTGGLAGGALGGLGGEGGLVDSATGIGGIASDVLVGAGAGALGAGVTGQNPLTGTLTGAGQGLVAGLTAPTPTVAGATGAPSAGTAGAGVSSGATGVAPASIGIASPDATAGLDLSGGNIPSASSLLSGSDALQVGAPPASSVSGPISGGPSTSSLSTPSGVDTSLSSGSTGSLSSAGGGTPGGGGTNIPSSSSLLSGTNSLQIGSSAPSGLTTGGAGTAGAGLTPSAGAASGGADVGGGPTTSVGKFAANPSLSGAGDILASNPGAVVSALGLGYNALKGNQPVPGQSELSGEAATLASQGKQLSSYIQTGNLPPGVQNGINQAAEAAKATIRSQYASMGLSGSSSEQLALASIDQQSASQGAQIATNLLQQGISAENISAQLYQSLLNTTLSQDANLSSAIGGFASAIGGGTPVPRPASTGPVG